MNCEADGNASQLSTVNKCWCIMTEENLSYSSILTIENITKSFFMEAIEEFV